MPTGNEQSQNELAKTVHTENPLKPGKVSSNIDKYGNSKPIDSYTVGQNKIVLNNSYIFYTNIHGQEQQELINKRQIKEGQKQGTFGKAKITENGNVVKFSNKPEESYISSESYWIKENEINALQAQGLYIGKGKWFDSNLKEERNFVVMKNAGEDVYA